MSPTTQAPQPRLSWPARIRLYAPLVTGLVCVWLALWQQFDLISVTTGIAFALIVVGLFHLPEAQLVERVHVLWLIVLIGRVLGWIVRSSLQLAWLTIRPQAKPKPAIIAHRMRTRSDWMLTLTALLNMFVPGSVVVDVDGARNILYLHLFAADGADGIKAARQDVYRIEDALALAFASQQDLYLINRWRAERGQPPLWASRRQRAYEAAVEQERMRHSSAWEEES